MHFSPMDPESGLVSTLSVRLKKGDVKRGVRRVEAHSLARTQHPPETVILRPRDSVSGA